MALSIGEIFVHVQADTAPFQSKMGRVQNTLTGMATLSRGVVTALAAIGTGLSAGGLAGIKLAASLEQTQVAFEHMLGGAEQAAKFLQELRVFAKKTPFQFTDLVRYAQQLKGIGFGANRVIPILTAVGDAVAYVGGGADVIERIVRQFGQMRAKGKASAEEMQDMASTAIPVWDMLATGLGVDIPKAMDMMEKRVIDGTDVVNILVDQMEQRFGGMMAEQAKTLAGQWSNVVDSGEEALTSIGGLLVEMFDVKTRLAGVAEWLDGFNTKLSTIKKTLEDTGKLDLGLLFSDDAKTVIEATAGAITGMLTPALWAFAVAAGTAGIALAPFALIGAGAAVVIKGIKDVVAVLTKGVENIIGPLAEGPGVVLDSKWDPLVDELKKNFEEPTIDELKQTWAEIEKGVAPGWVPIKMSAANAAHDVLEGEGGLRAKFDEWGAAVADTWVSIKTGVQAGWENIKAAIATWAGNVLNGAGGLKSLLGGWIAEVKRVWDIIVGYVEDITNALTGGGKKGQKGGGGEGGGGGTAESGLPPIQGPPLVSPPLPGLGEVLPTLPALGPRATLPGPPMPPVAEPPPLPPLPDIERQGGGRHAILMADGGLVTRPTFAMVGEAGPEAVIPLDNLGRIAAGLFGMSKPPSDTQYDEYQPTREGVGPITVNATFHMPEGGWQKDPRRMAEEMMRHIGDAMVHQMKLKGIKIV